MVRKSTGSLQWIFQHIFEGIDEKQNRLFALLTISSAGTTSEAPTTISQLSAFWNIGPFLTDRLSATRPLKVTMSASLGSIVSLLPPGKFCSTEPITFIDIFLSHQSIWRRKRRIVLAYTSIRVAYNVRNCRHTSQSTHLNPTRKHTFITRSAPISLVQSFLPPWSSESLIIVTSAISFLFSQHRSISRRTCDCVVEHTSIEYETWEIWKMGESVLNAESRSNQARSRCPAVRMGHSRVQEEETNWFAFWLFLLAGSNNSRLLFLISTIILQNSNSRTR